ncbi:Crp/Fnr family transcriptional regulator [Nocardiopsis composta]|uniref:CRP-like cAMP-binding protein n=1 Tax=Nocardiopsis composta TaxID=157465 RepID=A0A7W8QT37_9ACTN|nr:Crp/Fnr family transcriptional regulator [Nocardiopsis composta]MBB5436078.1 CRP-like cAMP-binding protein [Nocardiopsis composta]
MGRQGFGALVSDDQWTLFLRAGSTRKFADGEPIIRQGEREDVVHMLAEGTVKVTAVRPDGIEALLALRGPGEALGEMSALTGRARSATVAASGGPCTTRVLSGHQFRLLLHRQELHGALLEHLVLRQTEGESVRTEITVLPSGQRIAAALLRLAALTGTDVGAAPGGKRGVVLRLGLSQREIGDWVGLSRASVAAEFRRLRDCGVIRTGRQYIAVLDVDRLRRISEGDPPA